VNTACTSRPLQSTNPVFNTTDNTLDGFDVSRVQGPSLLEGIFKILVITVISSWTFSAANIIPQKGNHSTQKGMNPVVWYSCQNFVLRKINDLGIVSVSKTNIQHMFQRHVLSKHVVKHKTKKDEYKACVLKTCVAKTYVAKQNKCKACVVKIHAANENLYKSSGGAWGAPGINARACVHSHTLLQLIYILGTVPICLDASLVAERGANAHLGKVAERYENVSTGTTLEDRYASGTAADRFLQVKKCTVEPTAAAKGDTYMGASTAVRGGFRAGMAWAHSFAAAETASASGLAHLPDLLLPA
jgi:hypothetical protein